MLQEVNDLIGPTKLLIIKTLKNINGNLKILKY
jgi:hypothetical protein